MKKIYILEKSVRSSCEEEYKIRNKKFLYELKTCFHLKTFDNKNNFTKQQAPNFLPVIDVNPGLVPRYLPNRFDKIISSNNLKKNQNQIHT